MTSGLLIAATASAQVVSESFTGSTFSDPNWVVAGSGYTPILTGDGVIDPVGDGWLRLTDTGGNIATSAYLDTAFNAAGAAVYASFEYATWGGNGADGMTFFLFDGSVPFSVGAPGGSLGYANRNAEAGMAGGYIGVGIDEFGNFSSTSEGKTGGLRGGLIPDAIAVRGSEASGWAFLGSSDTLATSIDTPGVGTRPTVVNEVQILLTATNQLTVTLQQGGTNPQTVLQMDLSAYARPDTLKLGFAGSTGGLNNFHEIRNVEASTITASLWDNQGDSTWGNNNNWNPSVVPTIGSDILFDNTYVSTNQTIDVGTDRSVRSVTFDAPFDYTLNNNTITLDNQGVAGFSGINTSQTRGTGDHTINSDLVANNDIFIRNNNEGALTLTGDLNLNDNTVTFDGTGDLTTGSGAISGTGDVVKNDSGSVTLSGNSTYSGGTTINNGTLNANSGNALGTGGVELAGGTLGSTNGSSIGNIISLTGDAGFNGITTTGAITQTGNRTVDLNGANLNGTFNIGGGSVTADVGTDSAIGGVISNGSLTKDGTGTLTLSGANTYAGGTTINDGTLTLGASNVLANNGDVNIGGNGTLNLNGNSERIDDLRALGDGAALDFGSTSGANSFLFDTFTAAPAGGVTIINNWEQGLDQLATLRNDANVSSMYFSGFGLAERENSLTAINGLSANGYIIKPVEAQFKEWDGSSNNNWSTNNNWTAPGEPTSTQVALFGDLGVGRPDVNLNQSYTIAGFRFDTDATVNYDITSGNRDITLAGPVPYIQQFSDFDQRLGFDDLFLQNNTVVDITGAGNLTINADIKDSGGSRALIKDGTGTGKLILDFNFASYTGGLFVNNGIVQARDDQSLGTGTANVAEGATLEFFGSLGTIDQDINITGDGVGGNGALRNVSGTSTLSETITATGDAKITADAGATSNYTGNITGSGSNLTFGGDGNINIDRITTGTGGVTVESGTVTFQSGDTNTYTGLTSVTGGTLVLDKNNNVDAINTGGLSISNSGTVRLDSNNQIDNAAAVTLDDNATFDLNNNQETIAQLDSTSANALIDLGNGGDLTVGANSVIYSNYEGQIAGNAASTFNVDGLGTVYLAGDNSGMAGTFNVDSGTLNVRGNDNVLGTGDTVVDAGGNLQVQGGISLANDITLNGTGTTLNGALQNFSGNNTVAGTVTLGSDVRIGSDAGNLTLSGNVNGGGNTLTKSGNGDLTVSGTNTYANLNIIGGSFNLGANNVLSDSLDVTIGDTATLNIGDFNDTIDDLDGSGTLTIGSAGSLAIDDLGKAGAFDGVLDVDGVFTLNGGTIGAADGAGSTGTMVLANSGTLAVTDNFDFGGTLELTAGTTLELAGAGSTFDLGTLEITGDSVIDFGAGIATTLALDNLVIAPGVTLTVNNWIENIDLWTTAGFENVTINERDDNTAQITFNGFNDSDTIWKTGPGGEFPAFPGEITVPEPGTYGAVMMAFGLALWTMRRRPRPSASV